MIIYDYKHQDTQNYLFIKEESNPSYPSHLHKAYELIFLKSGSISLTIDGNITRLSAGDMAIIFPNQIHSYSGAINSIISFVIFLPSYISDFYYNHLNMLFKKPVLHQQDESIISEIKADSNQYILKSLLYKIISMYYSQSEMIVNTRPIPGLINDVLLNIQRNNTSQNLKQLAKKLNYNYQYLSHKINEIFGCNFCTLVNEQRIGKARFLLNNSEKTITEICHECGFKSLRTFNRSFVRICNTTPSKFKNK